LKRARETSALNVRAEKLENRELPFGYAEVQEIVAFVRRLAEGRVNLENVRFVKTLEFSRDLSARCGVVVVGRVDEHDGSLRLIDRRKHTLPQVTRESPRIGARAKCHLRAYAGVIAPRRAR
jgi:hypothetical protein